MSDSQTQYWTEYRSRYAMLVVSNAHISTTLSHPLSKNINDWKSYVPAVPMIMFFKVLKYFSNDKISFFLFAWPNFLFFRNLEPHSSRLFSPEKCWFLASICLVWKLMEYTNGHSQMHSQFLHFRIIFITVVTANFQLKNYI